MNNATGEDATPQVPPEQLARLAIGAGLRHAALAQSFATKTLGEEGGQPH